MDSRFLQSLIYVTETGSIAQAARIQHLTAAAISQRIKTLEMELGIDLLVRTGHCARPTDACARILSRARHIVKEVQELAGDIRSKPFVMPLRLGVIPSQWSPNLPRDLESLRERWPQIRVSLFLNTSKALYDGLLKGELDAVIVVSPHFNLPRHIHAFLLRTETLVLISKSSDDRSVHDILCSSPYVEYVSEPFTENIVKAYLDEQGLELHAICDTGSLATVKVLVQQGTGVSLVPRWPGIEDDSQELYVKHLGTSQYSRDIVLLTPEAKLSCEVFKQLQRILSPT